MRSQEERPMSAAFIRICDLALELGVRAINGLPACWEHQVDEHWFIAVNGHGEAQKTSNGNAVPPFNCYIEFSGFPAGLITPYDGIIAAGSVANEDSFIAALERATEKARKETGA